MKRPVLAVVAMLALAAAGCAPKLSPVEEAIRHAHIKGDYETLRALAEGGDRAAQAFLGQDYYLRQDHAKAAKWLRIAAQRGNPPSQYYFGLMYRDGLGGVPKDIVHAYKWFILSAKGASSKSWPKPVDTWDPLYRRFLARLHEKTRRSLLAEVKVARDALAAEMSAAERADAERLARAWKPIP